MSVWQSGEVIANGLRMHYTRTGGDKPPLVLSHGITDDGLCWTPITQALEADYDVLMVDARGHGRSEVPQGSFGPLDQAADLASFITALDLHKPILLGHSMGAVTTLVMASLHPQVPRAILLEDPPDWWMPKKQAELQEAELQEAGLQEAGHFAQIKQWLTGLKSKPREQIIAEQRAAAPTWSEAELQPWADAKLRFDLRVLSIFGPNPADDVDWPQLLPHITCPVLLITADPALGSVVTPTSAQALQALVPQTQIAHIPGAGHNIRREQLDRYLVVVRAFLQQHAH
jgi:pimeloyl-ACP methyl ester carboxylesterase